MFGISGTELFIVAVFALIIFGPDKLPAMARTVGRFMKEFKRTQESVESMLRAELYSAEKPEVDAVYVEPTVAAEPPAPVFGDDVDDEEEDEE